MKTVAIPTSSGTVDAHFGHCAEFTLFDVTEENTLVEGRLRTIDAPPHQPGLLPKWLAVRGINVILAGGMGQRAIELFNQEGVDVLIGIKPAPVEEVIAAYLDGSLQAEGNLCDH